MATVDLDSAVTFIDEHNLVAQLLPTDIGHYLVERCTVCEVLDYAGRYAECKQLLEGIIHEKIGATNFMQLLHQFANTDDPAHDLNDLTLYRRYAIACLQLGMIYYRKNKYEDAKGYFALSERVLSRIHSQVTCFGELARAEYCLGLVARQEHDYDIARQKFSDSVQHAWQGLEQRANPQADTDDLISRIYTTDQALRFHVGRVLSLGLGWIAYTRAALAEAEGNFVAARLLLKDSNVRYIHAYVNLLHACTLISARGDSLKAMDEAIKILLVAYSALGGRTILARTTYAETVGGNGTYALRCANELGRAHLRAASFYHEEKGKLEQQKLKLDAQISEATADGSSGDTAKIERLRRESAEFPDKIASASQQEQTRLRTALEYVEAVKDATKPGLGSLYSHEIRTYCHALVTETRAWQLRGQPREALKVALRANETGAKLGFTHIECLLNLAEAYYHCGRYAEAIDAYKDVRGDSHAQTNPKLLAVCDLNLTRCYANSGKFEDAHSQFHRWVAPGRPGRQNTFIRALAREVEEMINSPRAPFWIDVEADLKYEEWHDRLRYWLAANAMRRSRNDKNEARRMIGMTRKCVDNWLKLKSDADKKGR